MQGPPNLLNVPIADVPDVGLVHDALEPAPDLARINPSIAFYGNRWIDPCEPCELLLERVPLQDPFYECYK